MYRMADGILELAKQDKYWVDDWQLGPEQTEHVDAVESDDDLASVRFELSIENRTSDAALGVFLQTNDCNRPNYFVEVDGKHVLQRREAAEYERYMAQADEDIATLVEELDLSAYIQEKGLDTSKAEDTPKIKSIILRVMHAVALWSMQQQFGGSRKFVLYREGQDLRLREEDAGAFTIVKLEKAGNWAMDQAYVMSLLEVGAMEETP